MRAGSRDLCLAEARTYSYLYYPGKGPAFFAPRMFDADVEWMLRAVHRQPRKFLQRWERHTINCAVVLFQTLRSKYGFRLLNIDFTGVEALNPV